jgi:YebC/PmpR family DNA-binding regulatory protein
MSGHSKWATIKRKKGATDAKRGATFTKLSNLITIAAKEKGGDLDTNFMLRMAVDKAKQVNMPKDNIDKAIKRGTGELAGDAIMELIYEAVGPANSQYIIKVLSDNKNRAASNIRHLLSKSNATLSSVMWNFSQKGVIRILSENSSIIGDDEELELIELGAEDIKKEDEGISIITLVESLQEIRKYLDDKKIPIESADIEYIAKDTISLSEEDQEKTDKLEELLEDCEDVSDYYSNISF